MHSLKITEEFLYNSNNSIAAKLLRKTIIQGDRALAEIKDNCFEIWLLKSLHCSLSIENKEFKLNEGDILVFSGNDKKTIQYADRNAVFLVLQIKPDAFLEMLPGSTLFDNYMFLYSHSNKFNNHISYTNPVANQITGFLYACENAFVDKNIGYELSVIKNIYDTLLCILNETAYCNTLGSKHTIQTKQHKALKKAIDYIDSHLSEELTLDKISRICELSPNYLSNIFREQTGSKLWDYISEKRISLATQLLVDHPNDSIISIALKCGFNNCPNFNRAFKKYTGQTPKRYKTSIIKQDV